MSPLPIIDQPEPPSVPQGPSGRSWVLVALAFATALVGVLVAVLR